MSDASPISWPQGLTELPTWLAIPLSEYLAEPNPRVRLHWMLDTVEVAIRWAVAIALADVRLAHEGVLPKMLQRSIQDHIERPTVGRWVGMLRALSKSAPGAPISPAVFALHDDHIAPLFTSEGHETDSMLVLRNRVAHGGGISSRKSAELVTAHDGRFLDLMRAIGRCTDGLHVHGHHPEGDHHLAHAETERHRERGRLRETLEPRPAHGSPGRDPAGSHECAGSTAGA